MLLPALPFQRPRLQRRGAHASRLVGRRAPVVHYSLEDSEGITLSAFLRTVLTAPVDEGAVPASAEVDSVELEASLLTTSWCALKMDEHFQHGGPRAVSRVVAMLKAYVLRILKLVGPSDVRNAWLVVRDAIDKQLQCRSRSSLETVLQNAQRILAAVPPKSTEARTVEAVFASGGSEVRKELLKRPTCASFHLSPNHAGEEAPGSVLRQFRAEPTRDAMNT
jgi:hypothetical protein